MANSDESLADIRHRARNQYRQNRRALTSYQQTKAASDIARRIAADPVFIRAKHITAYLPSDGEIDTRQIIHLAWSMRKTVYLPIIDALGVMRFISYHHHNKLITGKWGIPHPKGNKRSQHPLIFDLILTPLVAFDKNGNRLGRGGGFYDKFLAKTRSKQKHSNSPYIMGLAHNFQQSPAIQSTSWDIPLHGALTDTQRLHF